MGAKKAEPVLRAALKYKMELAESRLVEHIHSLAKKTPLAVWAIACRLRLEETAAHAARCSLSTFESLSASRPEFDPEDLKGVSAGQYFRLRQYRMVHGEVDEGYRFLDPTPKQELKFPSPGKQPQDAPIHIPSPDLICLSCDGKEFRVRKEPLCAASPVIQTLVMAAERSLARSPSSSSSDSEDDASSNVCGRLPRVQLGYSAAALSILFRFYNLGSLEWFPRDPRPIAEVIAATRQYRMQGLLEIASNRWCIAVRSAPLRAYLAAMFHRLHDLARQAANLTLRSDLENHYLHDLEASPALDYQRLSVYRATCSVVAATSPLLARRSSPAPGPSCTSSEPKSRSWTGIQVARIRTQLSLCPGLAEDLSSVGSLFSNATEKGRVWCSECSPLAQDLLNLSRTSWRVALSITEVTLETS